MSQTQNQPQYKGKKDITQEEYYVTRMNGTEPPFQNKYWNFDEPGIYVDIHDGAPLFLSTDKFPSSCGWPAFAHSIDDAVKEKTDLTHGMIRTEVRSKTADSHLGHVFNDGPKALGGLRYCINSAAVRFVPLADMEKEGYGAYIEPIEKALKEKNQKA